MNTTFTRLSVVLVAGVVAAAGQDVASRPFVSPIFGVDILGLVGAR